MVKSKYWLFVWFLIMYGDILMNFGKKFVLFVFAVCMVLQPAFAWPPFRKARTSTYPVASSNQTVNYGSYQNQSTEYSAQSVAQAKAEQQASEGRTRHVGGGFGGGAYEGVGFSTYSSEQAIAKCCYWGQRTPIGIGVARGHNGWYACVLYR